MNFPRIDYLEWARTHMGQVPFDLAKSNIKAVEKADLGLTLRHVRLHTRTDDGVVPLRDLIAARYDVGRENILVTSGATMGIFLTCAATLEPGDDALIEIPHYEPLRRAAEQAGARLRPLPRPFANRCRIDPDDLRRRVRPSTRAILLTNLHNPSGAAIDPPILRAVGRAARGARIVVSEVYLDGAFRPGLRAAATLGPQFVSIGSLSKVYGLGGLRIGWIVAHEAVIRRARLALDYVECDLPVPSESIAVAALRRASRLVRRCRSIAEPNVRRVGEWVRERGDLRWLEPEGGTVCLVKLPPRVDDRALVSLLQENYGTLVVPGAFFGLRGFIRVSCGIDEEVLRQGLRNVSLAIDRLKPRRTA